MTEARRSLRILTNNVHTAYSAELARLGHEFHSANDSWDITRPRPENWKAVDLRWARKNLKFDLILVNHDWGLASDLLDFGDPMIFSVLADGSEGVFPRAIEERCAVVTFLGKEAADRWKLENPLKKRIIELGIDGTNFKVEDRSGPTFLTVGNQIGKRWDKGHCAYTTVSEFLPLALVGPGNDGLPGALGPVSYERLLELYATSKVYFNPGPIVGISMAEAMMAGLPVVTFRTINLRGLIRDGVNGFVVDTVDGALLRLRELEADPGLRMAMGAASRETAEARFDFDRWQRNWDFTFENILR